VGAALLRDVLAADQPVALQPVERDVDLADVRRRVRAAERLLQRELQLVPVRGLLGQQGQQRLTHTTPPFLSLLVVHVTKPCQGRYPRRRPQNARLTHTYMLYITSIHRRSAARRVQRGPPPASRRLSRGDTVRAPR